MASYRPVRVGELIQAELSQLVLRDLKDPRVQMATISHVEVSSDLRHARVFISRLGTASEQAETLAGFQRAAGFIRSQLAKRLTLRYIPTFTFELDTAIAYGVRVSQMLHDLLPAETPPHSESSCTTC